MVQGTAVCLNGSKQRGKRGKGSKRSADPVRASEGHTKARKMVSAGQKFKNPREKPTTMPQELRAVVLEECWLDAQCNAQLYH